MAGNDTQKRRIVSYPSWYYNKLIVAYSFKKQQTKGETAEEMNKRFFDSLPEEQKNELLKLYDQMALEEKKFPKLARIKRFDD